MIDFNKWKVSDLKTELKKRGLPQAGIKSILVARLEEAESGAADQNNSPDSEDDTEEVESPKAAVSETAGDGPDTLNDDTSPEQAKDLVTIGSTENNTLKSLKNDADGNKSADTRILLTSQNSADHIVPNSSEENSDKTTPIRPNDSVDQITSESSKENTENTLLPNESNDQAEPDTPKVNAGRISDAAPKNPLDQTISEPSKDNNDQTTPLKDLHEQAASNLLNVASPKEPTNLTISASPKNSLDQSKLTHENDQSSLTTSVSPKESPKQTLPDTTKEATPKAENPRDSVSKSNGTNSPQPELVSSNREANEDANRIANEEVHDDASEDRQKRKRGPESPSISVLEISQKRPRTSDRDSDNSHNIIWDHKVGDAQNDQIDQIDPIDSSLSNSEPEGIFSNSSQTEHGSNSRRETRNTESKGDEITDAEQQNAMDIDPPNNQDGVSNTETALTPTQSRRDSRFKGLFNGGDNSTDVDMAYEQPEFERAVSPAIHPATTALYIRDMQRPLNPQQFRSHLSALAAPPGQSPNPDLILSFYLDPIRTHAFVSFSSIYAASRVRTALHSRIWPEERNRKPLWVDFVPEEKLEDWIIQEQESNTGGRSMAKKWEVCYDVDENRQVNTSLQEATNAPLPAQLNPSTTPQASSNHIPLGPRTNIDGAPSGPRSHLPASQPTFAEIAGSKLNELFNFTTTKPVLYWKPVSKELANKRLDCLEDSYSAEVKAGGRVIGDPHRYTFEEGDVLVDRGVELVPGLRPPPGYRAPRPGGDRGGYNGGISGRGRGGMSRFRGRGGPASYRGNYSDKYNYGHDSRSFRDYRRH